MNVFSFIGLIRTIYGKKLPDLDRIQDKGLLAVKIAQHFALRIDFLDEKVCRHLSKLFTNARPVKKKNGKELVEQYVDKSWFDNFSSFEETPFTAASNSNVLVTRKIEGKTFDELLRTNQLDIQTLLDLLHIHGLFLLNETEKKVKITIFYR